MMVTIRSSSSVESSPALKHSQTLHLLVIIVPFVKINISLKLASSPKRERVYLLDHDI